MNGNLITRIAHTTLDIFDYDVSKWGGIAISVLYPVAGTMCVISIWGAVAAVLNFLNAPTPVADVTLAVTGYSLATALVIMTAVAVQRIRILVGRND